MTAIWTPEFRVPGGATIFPYATRSDRLLCQPVFLSNGRQGYIDRNLDLRTYLILKRGLRITEKFVHSAIRREVAIILLVIKGKLI
jgi:hypothetical protein